MNSTSIHPRLRVPLELSELLLTAATQIAQSTTKAFLIPSRPCDAGQTLRPGEHTPLWNELRAQLRPLLKQRGQQAYLGRILGLPRQRVHAFLTRGDQMPDAERTLQLLAWLIAARQGKRPA